MNHDFGPVLPVGGYNDPDIDRFDILGNTCTNIHGVMGDFPLWGRDKFTACSQEDFTQHYNQICEACGEQCRSSCLECGKPLRCI